MARTFAYGAALAQGSWPCQEDGFLVDPVRRLFAVADGFGGRGAGDLAAKIALAEIRRPGAEEGSASPEAGLLERLRSANKQILERNQGRAPGSRGGASLLAGSVSPSGGLTLVHTGATAAFLWRAGALLPLLLPQAAPREEYQALLPDQALGLSETLRTESRQLSLQAGDILFLASGGLEWETDAFRNALAQALLLRAPGESLAGVTQELVDQASLSAAGWNRTLVAAERL